MRTHAILSLLTLMACSTEETKTIEQPINNGFKPATFEKTVFYVSSPPNGCTGTNVRYPRCIVTASHCTGNAKEVVAGENPAIMFPKKQSVADKRQRADNVYTDIGVLWLEAKLPGVDERMVPPTDYTPMGLGLATPTVLGRKSSELGTKIGAPLASVIVGYGEDGKGGSGIKAIGLPWITAFHQGSQQSTAVLGSVIRLDPNVLHQISCHGDSGGPLWPVGAGWQTYGVSSQSARPDNNDTCSATLYSHYTAFDDAPMGNTAGNWTWTSDTMEQICTQWLNVKIEGEGSVAGQLLPKQRKNFGVESNDRIDCPGDCIEDFHQLDTPDHRPPQQMDIVATPDSGWRFSHWKSESMKKKCQCDGSTNPTCNVKQQPMGYYSKTESIDEDTCIAVFVQDNDGGGYDSGMDDSDSGSSDAGSDAPDDSDDGSDSADGGVDAADED